MNGKYEDKPKGLTNWEIEKFHREWTEVTRMVLKELEKRGFPEIRIVKRE